MRIRLLIAAWGLAASGLAALCGAAPGARAAENQPCPGARASALVLPHLRDAIANNREVTIVALGSSSTQGWHASDIAHSYPSLLQSNLSASLPSAHVAVLNRGVGGQDVGEMLPRIESDVLAVHPTVVIWQVGANGAMKRIAPELFKRLLAVGVKRMRDAKVDVVLMDNQRAPAILASPEHVQIDQVMADVATAAGAGLFRRGDLMEQWRDAGYPYDRFVSDDGVHHNDYGYRCVAQALASSIMAGLATVPPDQTLSARR